MSRRERRGRPSATPCTSRGDPPEPARVFPSGFAVQRRSRWQLRNDERHCSKQYSLFLALQVVSGFVVHPAPVTLVEPAVALMTVPVP